MKALLLATAVVLATGAATAQTNQNSMPGQSDPSQGPMGQTPADPATDTDRAVRPGEGDSRQGTMDAANPDQRAADPNMRPGAMQGDPAGTTGTTGTTTGTMGTTDAPGSTTTPGATAATGMGGPATAAGEWPVCTRNLRDRCRQPEGRRVPPPA
jgi:hypothetical protein